MPAKTKQREQSLRAARVAGGGREGEDGIGGAGGVARLGRTLHDEIKAVFVNFFSYFVLRGRWSRESLSNPT